jgi:uncharacterized protein with PIN domain
MPPNRPKFAVDEMLGTLARWLRIMGYDATYEQDHDDKEIIETAMAEDRILLTRDRELAAKMGERGLFIGSDRLEEQLRQVWQAPMEEGMAKDKVPEGVFLSNREFFQCQSCGKVYWRGTHWLNIKKRLTLMDPGQSL